VSQGPATFQLVMNDLRWTKFKHRAPGSDHWEDMTVDAAMNRIAQLSANPCANFKPIPGHAGRQRRHGPKRVMNTYALARARGATMDQQWN